MKILALELSSDWRSVAALDSGLESDRQSQRHGAIMRRRIERRDESRLLGFSTRQGKCSTQTFGMIRDALNQAEWKRDAVECVAVGLGPGSYTGIRIAIATAQGWQSARDVALIGVNSADAVALEAARQGVTGEIQVAIDAQRKEFYMAGYGIDDEGVTLRASLNLVKRTEVARRIEQGERVVGPGIASQFPDANDLWPHADVIALMAAEQRDFCSGETLEPIYLRQTEFVKAPKPRISPG